MVVSQPDISTMPSSLSDLFSVEHLLHTSGGGILLVFMLFAFARGIARQLLGMVCLAVGFVAGYLAFKNAPEYLDRWLGIRHPNAAIISSIIVGFAVSRVAKRLLNGMVIPGAGAPDSGGMRVRSAGLSLIPACFLLWVAGMGIRWTGALAQMKFIDEGIRDEKQSLPQSSPLFARLQQSISSGWVGNLYNRTDPISSTEASALCSLLLIQRDAESWQRLHQDPNAAVILSHPAVKRLKDDKDWRQPASFKNYAALITLPDLAAALKDPVLVENLQHIDVEAVARHAMGATPALE